MNKTICLAFTGYNRGHLLKYTLESVCKFTLPDEIIIVDDGSTDNTAEVVHSYQEKLPMLWYIYNHNPGYTGACLAKNIAIRNSTCDYLIMTEFECIFINDVVKRCYELIINGMVLSYSAGYVIGVREDFKQTDQLIKDTTNFLINYPKKIYTFMDWRHGGCDTYPRPAEGDKECIEINIGNIAMYLYFIKREHLLVVNGYDESFPEVWGADDCDIQTRIEAMYPMAKHKVDIDIRIAHQWHGRPIGYYEGIGAKNAAHLQAKKLPEDIVANKNKEWGIIKTR